jgi:hypothetical protein
MNVWQQLDQMKAKFDKDMRDAEAACKAYKFVGLKALPHGVWMARSSKAAKHSREITAPNAEALVAEMRKVAEAAEKKN